MSNLHVWYPIKLSEIKHFSQKDMWQKVQMTRPNMCDTMLVFLSTDFWPSQGQWLTIGTGGRSLTWPTARSPARSHGGWTGQWTTPSGRCSAPPKAQTGPAGVCGRSHCTGELWGGRERGAEIQRYKHSFMKIQMIRYVRVPCHLDYRHLRQWKSQYFHGYPN